MLACACSPARIPLQAYDTAPDASPAGVLLEGVLTATGASPCIQLLVIGEPPVGLVWPPGYWATDGPLRIYDEAGVEVASEGVQVTLTGGIIHLPNAYCGTESLFRVSQVFEGAIEEAR